MATFYRGRGARERLPEDPAHLLLLVFLHPSVFILTRIFNSRHEFLIFVPMARRANERWKERRRLSRTLDENLSDHVFSFLSQLGIYP